MYPRIVINKQKFRHNLRTLLKLCHEKGLSMMAVSKVFSADKELVKIMIEEEVDYIADSRIENLKGIKTTIPKVLLRLPSISDALNTVEYADLSLNSEIITIEALNYFAAKLNKTHGVILMIDLGDLREGLFKEEEVIKMVNEIMKLENVSLKGIGTNLTCYGGVIPSTEILQKLVDYKNLIESQTELKLDIISGGNSSSLELVIDNKIPKGINNIRLGEAIVLGRETAYGNYLDNTYNDVFTLEAEIIELKEKPSIPIGEIGMNAFGKIPSFEDKGIVLRAILAIGKQDVDYTELIPDDQIELLGASSDHIIVNLSSIKNKYNLGDILHFKLTYSAILSLITSKYVEKTYD